MIAPMLVTPYLYPFTRVLLSLAYSPINVDTGASFVIEVRPETLKTQCIYEGRGQITVVVIDLDGCFSSVCTILDSLKDFEPLLMVSTY